VVEWKMAVKMKGFHFKREYINRNTQPPAGGEGCIDTRIVTNKEASCD
jgi:hypothetical protein